MAVTLVSGAAPLWRYNDTFPATFAGMPAPVGDGNLAADPLFAGAASGDFSLTSGSPARDAADATLSDSDGTRADPGVFGGI